MKILTRYILREFLIPLSYCLLGFMSIYLLFELFGSFSRLMAAKPGWGVACSYFLGYVAPYFKWMAPACLMLATLYTMWSFCRHSEIVAMRASGIGFFTIVKPLLAVAVLMSVAVVFVDEYYVPRRGQWAKQFKTARFKMEEMESVDDLVYHNAVGNRTWKIGYVVTADADVLEGVKVSVNYPVKLGGGRRMTINAPRAEYLDGQWMFLNATVAYFDAKGEEMASPTPALEDLTLRSFPEFNETPDDFLLQNRDWMYYSTADRRRYLETHPSLSPDERQDYTYDLWAQIVAPFACLVITLFAIPAGIATGRQSVFKGVIGALSMFFAFYGSTIGCMILSKNGWMNPVFAAVLPDVVFFGIGCWMFWRQR